MLFKVWTAVKTGHSDEERHLRHKAVWESVFGDDEWLRFISSRDRFDAGKVDPVLIGPRLDEIYKSTPQTELYSPPLYLWLITGESFEQPLYKRERLLKSLRQPYEFDQETCEVRFPCGIILNIYEPWQRVSDFDKVDYSHGRLFIRGTAETRYIAWRDELHQLRRLPTSNIFSVKGVKRQSQAFPICVLNLPWKNGSWPILFASP